MKQQNKWFTISLITLVGTLLLSACNNKEKINETLNTTAETRILTDTLGNEVTIPQSPKKIIASYLEDYLVALDEIPVAQWTVGSGNIQDYLNEELKDVPTISYDFPYEEVLKYTPDLLLISSSALVEGGKYKEYSKIAPTYVVKNGEDINWRDQLTDIATVLNKEDQAKNVIDDYEELAQKTKETLAEKATNDSAAVLWVTNNQVFLVSETRSSGAVLYNDLSLKIPSLVTEVSKDATSDWSQVSLEKLAELDADHIFLVNSDETDPLFNESVWKNLPAVKNNQVYTMDKSSSWLYNGPIANTKIIQDVEQAIIK